MQAHQLSSATAPLIASQSEGFRRDWTVPQWPKVAIDGYAAVPVIASEAGSRRYIARVLQKAGYKVASFAEPQAALRALAQQQFDVVVVSGYQDHLEWCTVVQEARPGMPMLFVVEDDGPESVAQGFDAGADDCLPSPFLESDLNARVGLLYRLAWRRRGMSVPDGGNLRLDPARPRAQVYDRTIRLTGPEYRILWMLARARGAVLPFRHIEECVSIDGPRPSRSQLHRVMCDLRRKLTSRSGKSFLLNEPRVGYRLSTNG